MDLSKIKQIEQDLRRNDRNYIDKIFLNKEGDFYHAYDFSAWFINRYVFTEKYQKERNDGKPVNTIKSEDKNQEYVMVGFPIKSINKFCPNCNIIGSLSESGDMVLESTSIEIGEKTFEDLEKEFNEWKASIPKSELKKSVREVISKTAKESASEKRTPGLLQVDIDILNWDLDTHSPLESVDFLRKLKKQIIAHFT